MFLCNVFLILIQTYYREFENFTQNILFKSYRKVESLWRFSRGLPKRWWKSLENINRHYLWTKGYFYKNCVKFPRNLKIKIFRIFSYWIFGEDVCHTLCSMGRNVQNGFTLKQECWEWGFHRKNNIFEGSFNILLRCVPSSEKSRHESIKLYLLLPDITVFVKFFSSP